MLTLLASIPPLDPPVHLAAGIPFVLLLLCIALLPFIDRKLWEEHYVKVACGLALIPALYYLLFLRAPGPWLRAMEEYISFICLLSSLFIISGGIVIRVNRKATPLANSALLLVGAIVANVFGTTGASMLLIRPFIHMNRGHLKAYHIVFFIFIISNAGGLLTPIGDPPLFLGYLEGIPFRWALDHLWPLWLVAVGGLLLVFFILDTLDHARAERHSAPGGGSQVHILGAHNFIFISLVLFAVFRPGTFECLQDFSSGSLAHGIGQLLFSREVLMVSAALLSRRATSRAVYRCNAFSYGPIREVAILFIGIFSTMAPALGWLEQNAARLSVTTPGHYYFASGALSSVLDNAPTYLTFFKMRLGRLDPAEIQQVRDAALAMGKARSLDIPAGAELSPASRHAIHSLVANQPGAILDGTLTRDQIQVALLLGVESLNIFILAISAGSVLFGACTYIGNGPNFMVKSIADTAGVRTPSFGGYIVRYALPILIPLYALLWFVFLRG